MRQPKYITEFEKATDTLIKMFCRKQGCEVDYLVVDDITGVYNVGDYFCSLTDIYFDIKQNKPKGLIFEWQNYLTDYNLQFPDNIKSCFINYSSYCMGARFQDLNF
jgi:hypothetical protein